MIPKPISTFYGKITKRNAARFFEDCMKVKDERINWITEFAIESGANKQSIDLSRESLLPLWNSVASHVRWLTPAPFGPTDTVDKPEWFNYLYSKVAVRDMDSHSQHKGGYDVQSLWIMDGLAYYFGEVFVRTFHHMKWQSYFESRYDMSGMPHVLSSEWSRFNVCPWRQVISALVGTWAPGLVPTASDLSDSFDALIRQASS